MSVSMDISRERIAAFCAKWDVVKFRLFGSVLRKDFGADSDVDVLVSFQTGVRRSLLDLVEMRMELKGIFGRDIDLMTRRAVERSYNWIRRRAILDSAELIYAQ